MKIIETSISDALVIEPKIFADERGLFFESFNERAMGDAGIRFPFVQDNHSRSVKNVLRGLHYQVRQAQGKLVRVVAGEVFDVAVDLRTDSPTFGKWHGTCLSADNRRMFWIPPGCAHGFLVLSESADFVYKATDFYAPQHERTLLWNDPHLNIAWPLDGPPVLSAKDAAGARFDGAEVYMGKLLAVSC